MQCSSVHKISTSDPSKEGWRSLRVSRPQIVTHWSGRRLVNKMIGSSAHNAHMCTLTHQEHRYPCTLAHQEHRCECTLAHQEHRCECTLTYQEHRCECTLTHKKHRCECTLTHQKHRCECTLTHQEHRCECTLTHKKHRCECTLTHQKHRCECTLTHQEHRWECTLAHTQEHTRVWSHMRASTRQLQTITKRCFRRCHCFVNIRLTACQFAWTCCWPEMHLYLWSMMSVQLVMRTSRRTNCFIWKAKGRRFDPRTRTAKTCNETSTYRCLFPPVGV